MALTPGSIQREAFNTLLVHSEIALTSLLALFELNDRVMVLGRQLIANLRHLDVIPAYSGAVDAEDREWHANLAGYRASTARNRNKLETTSRELEAATGALFLLIEQMHTLFAQAKSDLAQSTEYQQLLLHEQNLEQDWRYANDSYAEIRDECVGKLALFEADPRFRFLRSRQFGTEHYPYGRVNRLLDQWLAKQIDYRRNRESESILLEMQDKNTRRGGELETSLNECRQQLDELRNAIGEQDEVRRVRIQALSLSDKVDGLLMTTHTEFRGLEELALCADEQGSKLFQSVRSAIQEKNFTQIREQLLKLPDSTDAATLKTAHELIDQLTGLNSDVTRERKAFEEQDKNRVTALNLLLASRNFLFSNCNCDFDCNCSCHVCDCLSSDRECSCRECRECACNCICVRWGNIPRNDSYDNQGSYQETLSFEQLAQSHIRGHVSIGALVKLVRLHKLSDEPGSQEAS